MERSKILLLRLEGPLQSWGEHSKWDWRDSALMPTKSGIVGLLGCALGLERGDAELAELSSAIRVAVRADRPGRLMVDFHTVHADKEKGDKIFNANGKPRRNATGDICYTIVTHRSYLQDASFLAAIEASEKLCDKLDAALHAPKWPVCLGRKSCVPSRPVYIGCFDIYTDLKDAVCRAPYSERTESTVTYEIESGDGSGYLRADELSDAAGRGFSLRRVIRKELRKECAQ